MKKVSYISRLGSEPLTRWEIFKGVVSIAIFVALAAALLEWIVPDHLVLVSTVQHYPAAGDDPNKDVYIIHYAVDGVPYIMETRGIEGREKALAYIRTLEED